MDAIFPGAGAVITNLSRFSDWQKWGYDWDLDIEPTLREIAERNGPGWMPGGGGLTYFDQPSARRHHARLAGHIPRATRSTPPVRELSIAEKRAYLEKWEMTRARPAEINARIKAEGLAAMWERGGTHDFLLVTCPFQLHSLAARVFSKSGGFVSAPCQRWTLPHER